jgi:hypothetical protein
VLKIGDMEKTTGSSLKLLAQFIKNGEDFLAQARAIPAGALGKTPIADEWSGAYVIHHMCDGDLHFLIRYLNNLAEDSPPIFPFNEEIYPERINYSKRDPAASLAGIAGNFLVAKDILTTIPSADWKRSSTHLERGIITLFDMVKIASDHSEAHAKQLQKIVSAL